MNSSLLSLCVGLMSSAIISCAVVAPLLLGFANGRLVRREADENDGVALRPVMMAAMLFGVAALVMEMLYHGRAAQTGLRWSTAAALALYAAAYDRSKGIIPNAILVVPLLVGALLLLVDVAVTPLYWRSTVGTYALGAFVAGGVFFVARLVTRGGVGAGDVKLFFVLGLLVGFVGVFNVMLYSMLASFVWSMVLLVTKRGHLNDELALGPFVLFGLALSIVFGA